MNHIIMCQASVSEVLYRSSSLLCLKAIPRGKAITPASDITASEFAFIWANEYDTFQMGKAVIPYSSSNGW